jgi:hypothetical protein
MVEKSAKQRKSNRGSFIVESSASQEAVRLGHDQQAPADGAA